MDKEGKIEDFNIKLRQLKRNEDQPEGVDEFKRDTCHSFHHDVPFRVYWEEILGLPPVDLNALTTGQVVSIGLYLEVIDWNGQPYGKDGNLLVKPPSRFHHIIKGSERGKRLTTNSRYFTVVDGECWMGLTKSYQFFDSDLKKLEELAPVAKQELDDIFATGTEKITNLFRFRAKDTGLALFEEKECSHQGKDYDLPVLVKWEKLGLPLPIDLNSMSFGQISSIGRALEMCYSDGPVKNGDYFSIVCKYSAKEGKPSYYYGLTKEYFYFDSDIPLEYHPDLVPSDAVVELGRLFVGEE